MIRHMRLAAAVLFCTLASGAVAQLPETVNWSVEPASRGEVQFSISYRTTNVRSNWSSTTPAAELRGLDLDAEGPVSFVVTRDAGRFDCEGVMRRGRGTGDCRFEGDSAFAAALERRGIGRPSRSDLYQLALARVGLGVVDELARQQHARPTVDELVQMGVHGADVAYVREMGEAGYRRGRADGLVQMRIHGVRPDLMRSLAEVGYPADAGLAVNLRIHGADSDYIAGMRRAAGHRFAGDDLVAMRIHGVTPEWVGELARLGYPNLEASQLIAMRIHGVTGDFVRDAVEKAPARPSPEQLVSLRITGRY